MNWEKEYILHNSMDLLKQSTAIILAGGSGSRMGYDKSQIVIHGKNILQQHFDNLSSHFDEVIVSVGKGSKSRYTDYPIVVEDRAPEKGPLMGIYSAVQASCNDINFVIAVDIPVIDFTVVKTLVDIACDYDIVVPSFREGQCDTLFAVYRKTVLHAIDMQIQKDQLKIIDVFPFCRAHIVQISNSSWYKNLNTPGDVAQFLNT